MANDMNATEYFQAGDLNEAISVLNDEIKRNPADVQKRSLLCEFLCFAGNLDRADTQLDAISKQDVTTLPGVSLFRHLLRAEQARQQFFTEGRLPEFLDEPSAVLQLHLQASICIREGNIGEAAQFLAQAEEQRVKVSGICGEAPFDDLRDLDDITAPVFEILTSTGKYYWIPMDRVISIEFEPPKRPRDLLWRQADVQVRNGPDGQVYFPTLYAGTSAVDDKQLRLGRATEWNGNEGEPMRGVGQKTFLVGEEDRTILELTRIAVNESAS
jgi:type VI secretion system protein ImpE